MKNSEQDQTYTTDIHQNTRQQITVTRVWKKKEEEKRDEHPSTHAGAQWECTMINSAQDTCALHTRTRRYPPKASQAFIACHSGFFVDDINLM